MILFEIKFLHIEKNKLISTMRSLSTSTHRKNGMGFAEDPEKAKKAVKENILREIFFITLF